MKTNNKVVICDIPNTLFDSRHRTIETGVCMVGIENDELNYSVYSLIKLFKAMKYKIVFTHYCLHRLSMKIKNKLYTHKLSTVSLMTNARSQNVLDNASLKKFVYKKLTESGQFVEYVIDNDETMKPYWLELGVGLIQMPLPLKYEDTLDDY